MFGSKNPIIHDLRNLQKIKIKNKKLQKTRRNYVFLQPQKILRAKKKFEKNGSNDSAFPKKMVQKKNVAKKNGAHQKSAKVSVCVHMYCSN